MTDSNDPYDLHRFVEAQESDINLIKEELQAGEKQSHWMWYVFPQVAGLGTSSMAERYAIRSRNEAEAYLAHDILGQRLRECTEIVNTIEGRSANEVFGHPDVLKFRSSMTLFEAVSDNPSLFETALNRYYDGERCRKTLDFLSEK